MGGGLQTLTSVTTAAIIMLIAGIRTAMGMDFAICAVLEPIMQARAAVQTTSTKMGTVFATAADLKPILRPKAAAQTIQTKMETVFATTKLWAQTKMALDFGVDAAGEEADSAGKRRGITCGMNRK